MVFALDILHGVHGLGELARGLVLLPDELDPVGVLLEHLLGQLLVLGEGLRRRVLDLDLVLVVECVQVRAVRQIFAFDFLEEELAVLHSAKQTPESAPADLVLVAGLSINCKVPGWWWQLQTHASK